MSLFISARITELLLTTAGGVAVITTLGYVVGRFVPQAARRHFVCAGALLASGLFSTSIMLLESQGLRIAALPASPVRVVSATPSFLSLGLDSPAPVSQSPHSTKHLPASQPDHAEQDRLLSLRKQISQLSSGLCWMSVVLQWQTHRSFWKFDFKGWR